MCESLLELELEDVHDIMHDTETILHDIIWKIFRSCLGCTHHYAAQAAVQ